MNAKDGFRKFLHSPWIFLVLFAAVLLLVNLIGGTNNYSMEINYSEFLKMLDEGDRKSVV